MFKIPLPKLNGSSMLRIIHSKIIFELSNSIYPEDLPYKDCVPFALNVTAFNATRCTVTQIDRNQLSEFFS